MPCRARAGRRRSPALGEPVRGHGAAESRADDDRVEVLWRRVLAARGELHLLTVHRAPGGRSARRATPGAAPAPAAARRRASPPVARERDVGHEVPVVLQHRDLGVRELVEVDARLRDHLGDQVVRVPRTGAVARREAPDPPVRPLELAGIEFRDQPSLAHVGRLLEQRDDVAQVVPHARRHLRMGCERRRRIRHEHDGVVALESARGRGCRRSRRPSARGTRRRARAASS